MSNASAEAIAAELLRLESALLDPQVRSDRKRVEELLTEDFLEFGSSGRIWSREGILDLLATESYTPPAIKDFTCRLLSGDVAHVTYRAVRKNTAGEFESDTLRSSIWMNRKERWQMLFHQGTRRAQNSSPHKILF